MSSPRFWVVAVLMCATAVLLKARGDVDRVPQSLPLDELPKTIGARTAVDIPMDPATLLVLGKGIFLNREYVVPPSAGRPSGPDTTPIGLYIGYFPTQRTGQSIHSPQNCLPGAGFSFVSSGVTELSDRSGRKYSVGEYLISDGISTDEVLYWYRIHGRSVANDYKAKLYTMADSIRYDRTDEALVRIITAVQPGEDRMSAHRRALDFANLLVPLLPAYIPD
jgi:EpsI family protein